MDKLTSIAAALLAALPGVANAAEPPCLSPAEFSSFAGYALPSVISGTAKRCSATLAPEAFLNRKGPALVERYRASKGKTWSSAKAAFLKLSTDKADVDDVLRNLPDESLQQMLDVILEGMVSQEIPLEKCGTIDSFVRLLSPLPPENTAELIALTVGLASSAKPAKAGKLTICKS